MRRLVAICTAGALLLLTFAASGVSASDGSRTETDEGGCAASSATNFIQFDEFAQEAYYRIPSSNVPLLWKPYYWAVEGTQAGFRITRASDDCSGDPSRAYFRTVDGTALSNQDFSPAEGWSNNLYDPDPSHRPPGTTYFQDVSYSVHANSGPEPVVESALVRFTGYDNAFGGNPSEAPFYFVDNQTPGFAFAEASYSHSEWGPKMPVPVFRGGPATTSQTVNFGVEGTGTNPAVEGENFEVNGTKSLTFAAGERVKVIDFSVINNRQPDGNRTFKVSLEGQTAQNETEITLVDAGGAPPVKPHSRFHHPRQGWKYQRGDFRIREIHTFAFDNGGPEIGWAKFGLRKKLRNGRCSWWTGSQVQGR